MATVASDTFTDTGSTTLQSHVPNTGTGWDTDGDSGLRIDAGGTFLTSNTDSRKFGRETTTIGDDDMDVTADCEVPASNGREAGVTGRVPNTVNGAANCYLLVMEEDGSDQVDLKLRKIVASTETELGSYDANVAINTFATIKLTIRTADVQGYIAGVSRISSTDDSLGGNNFAGVVHQNSGSSIDNFLSESVAAPPAGTTISAMALMGVGT